MRRRSDDGIIVGVGFQLSKATFMSDVTRILSAIEQGDQKASEQLLPLVYQELRKLAAQKMAQENPDQTLQATALVHEAYMRLVHNEKAHNWDNRGHFFAAAAEAMRRILIEVARRKSRLRHGGSFERQELAEDLEIYSTIPSDDLLAIDEALKKMESEDPTAARLVKLRFFVGFSMPEVAELLGTSLRSVEREWTYARSWLHREVSKSDTPVPES